MSCRIAVVLIKNELTNWVIVIYNSGNIGWVALKTKTHNRKQERYADPSNRKLNLTIYLPVFLHSIFSGADKRAAIEFVFLRYYWHCIARCY